MVDDVTPDGTVPGSHREGTYGKSPAFGEVRLPTPNAQSDREYWIFSPGIYDHGKTDKGRSSIFQKNHDTPTAIRNKQELQGYFDSISGEHAPDEYRYDHNNFTRNGT